ncbi:diacylglycerol/lipid kinase family protein [Roseibium aggregatum]|uniref:YegS/Rv2252/BmrU family lipid kinase n=1 Tax=Roseibium aggregatum TaxID=187304 RepID=A0A926S694_9HYPH|nr:YegS/Rv2252/BmrU family lipid kinase [Roseibium aggregatum]MBD1546247.1 YegS/Rv2252/BmrU family lipid kinase [Roseibium aggregatum]
MVRKVRSRFFIIHNPRSGRAAQSLYHATVATLKKHSSHVEIVVTARHGEGMKAAAEAAASRDFDAVVAAGGDGTVHDAAEGMAGSEIPLGIIPMGTGNVFARELNLPRSPALVARMLLQGEVGEIPVGEVNGKPFLFVVGVGFDAEAVQIFEKGSSREWGQAGFVWPVMRALLSHRDDPLRVITRTGQHEAQWVIVTRAKRYAGDLLLAPEADLRRRQFHVLCLRGSGVLTRVRQLSALATGLLRHDPSVILDSTDWVRIDGDPTTPVQIDGEALGQLPLEIGFNDKDLRLILP